jgi:hypothetical protein
MVDSDAIARRLLSLSECLNELARPEAGDAAARARGLVRRYDTDSGSIEGSARAGAALTTGGPGR